MTNLHGRMPTRGNPLKIPDIVQVQSGFIEDRHFAQKITIVGNTYYLAYAALGSSQASAVWQVKKIDFVGDDIIFTWCDGDDLFDNVATDLTTLSYS